MRTAAVLAILGALVAAPVLAQQTTGALTGTITDPDGAPLPGVTVTVSSPALLGGDRSAVTNASGNYRLPQLPVGSYTVTVTLQGFQTQVFEEIDMQAGRTFSLNVSMTLGAVEETVTVTGRSPVIDTADSEVDFNFTKEIMDNVPNARDVWALIAQAPGVNTSDVNVGGTNTGNQMGFTGYGVDERQNTYFLNGANITDNTNNGASQFYFDVDSFAEVQVEASSHSADVQTPGMVLNIVPKSGSNEFHGSASLYYNNDSVQANNVDSELRALGVDRASALNKYFDLGADFGGPIVENDLFFYASYRRQIVENFITGTQNEDGSFPIDRTELWFPSAKLSWQINEDHTTSFFWNMAQKKRFRRALSRLRPVETTWDQQGAPIARLFSLNHDWVASDDLLVSFDVNVMDQGFELIAQESVDTETTPARFETATGAFSDAPPFEFGIGKNLRHFGATVNYYADDWGSAAHDIQIGGAYEDYNTFGNQGGGVAQITYPADHRLIFSNGQPIEVLLFAPDASSVSNPTAEAYVSDAIDFGRLRLNLGLRWDYQVNKLDEVQAPPSRFFDPIVQQETDNLIEWNTIAPRVGVVYDLFGDARTLLKGSYNRYYWQLWVDKGSQVSVAGDRQARHVWNDANGDGNLQDSEIGDLLSINNPAANPVTIDPDLDAERTDEVTLGLTQELAPNLSVTANFIYRKDSDLVWRVNPNIGPDDFSPVTATDPGPDGTPGTGDDGGQVTFWEQSEETLGLSPNFITTRPNFDRTYKGLELNLYRRMVNDWQVVGSFSIGEKVENFGEGSFQNPQDIDLIDGTRVDGTVPWSAKVMGSYRFPFGVLFSGFYQIRSGEPFSRTVNSSGLVSLNQGNVTALAGERNEDTYDTINILDLRLAYTQPVGGVDLEFQFDGFNLLNSNTITDDIRLSGPAFGNVLDFIPPRIFRFGIKASF